MEMLSGVRGCVDVVSNQYVSQSGVVVGVVVLFVYLDDDYDSA